MRGYPSTGQTDASLPISEAPLAIAKSARTSAIASTTAGNGIGPMRRPNLKAAAETWQPSAADKQTSHCDARVLPGGRPDCDAALKGTGAQRESHVRKYEDVEPVAYNAIHEEVWD